MKVLEFHQSKDEDYLRFTFEGAMDPGAAWERELAPFLQALEEYADGWMPDVVEGKRQRKYTRASFLKALEERRDENSTGLGLYRTQWPPLDMSLGLSLPPLAPELSIMSRLKPLSFFAEEERCRKFVEMVRAWACRYPVSYASAHSIDDRVLAGSPNFGRDDETLYRDGFDKIYEVWWLNVFGPKLVETVGRERMLSTPAWRVEELPDGGILLVLWPTPAHFATEEARVAQARAHVHLRPDLDFDTVLRGLRERSAALAPVEPHFPPDVAPLLSRVVDDTSGHQRQRLIAQFNDWQPPEPQEWLPLDEAEPPNVESPEGVCDYYYDLAEHLEVWFAREVPSIYDYTAQSLLEVDAWLWREDFPRRYTKEFVRDKAVRAVGAYLGQVLVRRLGGRWIPRKRLAEAQVVVGGRVWLPMIRAYRYLQSRQALLDYSLTQAYREAERHRF